MTADWNALDDQDFRRQVREFLHQNYPEALRFPKSWLRLTEASCWFEALYRNGWRAPAWPVKYGGMGLGPAKLMVLIEEFEHYGVGHSTDMGITMVGPLLIDHGSEEQRAWYLPRILSGEHIWCQGYSEPNSGSDLASLRTEATPDGDDFVVNGQKTWTTLAQDATHIFMLVRTDRTGKKQEGISFLLADMTAPGVERRPILNLAGHEEFCECFFRDVRVPKANLVGQLNRGWTMAKALLSFERIFLGSPRQSQYAMARLEALTVRCELTADPGFMDAYARLKLDTLDHVALYARFVEQTRRGETLGADVSILKIIGTETYQRITQLMVEAAGSAGGLKDDVELAGGSFDWLSNYYSARPSSIYGGANEIQRNVLAVQVLGLPA